MISYGQVNGLARKHVQEGVPPEAKRKHEPESKMCAKCRKVLPASEFHADRSKKSGLSSYCRQCTKQYRARMPYIGWRGAWLREFSKRLRIAMDKKGVGDAELARKIGCDASTLRNWIACKGYPASCYIPRICRELRVPPGWLLGMSGNRL